MPSTLLRSILFKFENDGFYLHPFIVWGTVTRTFLGPSARDASVIKACLPKSVITFIDNNPRFHQLASRLPNFRFIAIQSGIRIPNYSEATLHYWFVGEV
jgi:surface carbohydrate biosynthesis protein